jgi:hypothetical protein
MQRHDPGIKPLPETQEQGTQAPPACPYCGKSLRHAATVEAYDHRWENLARGLTGDGGA